MEQKPIELEVKTKGFEEAEEKIEGMADALRDLPAQVTIKAHDCTFNIYPSHAKINYSAVPMPARKKETKKEDECAD